MIKVDYKNPMPIHEQVQTAMIRLMMQDVFQKNDRLPSVHFLAQELAVNPNSIEKAYSALASQGFVYKGEDQDYFVQEKVAELGTAYEPELFGELDKAVCTLVSFHVEGSRIEERVRKLIEQVGDANGGNRCD